MSKFDDLIEKYQKGFLKGKQKELMDAWFENLGKNEKDIEWNEFRKDRVKHQLLAKIDQTEPCSLNKRNKKRKWMSVAAMFIGLIASVFFVWNYTATIKSKSIVEVQKLSTSNISQVILPDGSIVWLKAYSKLSYPEEFSRADRFVKLEGEALFEVAHNPDKPFIIACGSLKTTVLGTSFNIRATGNDIEVNVLTGKVALSVEESESNMVLLPNEMGVFDKNELRLVKKVTSDDLTASIKAGTKYTMKFEDAPMELVTKEIERKYNVEVHVKNKAINNCLITADFSGQALDMTLHMIGQALEVDYSVEGNQVIMEGQGCEQ